MRTHSSALSADTALLLLRVVVGVTFLLHGIDKLRDLEAARQSFDGLGIPLADVMAPAIASLEVAGGVALVLGLLAPLFGLLLAGNMLVAGLTAHADGAFFASEGGFELVLLLGVGSLAVAVGGAGRLALDHVLGVAERVPFYPGATRSTASA